MIRGGTVMFSSFRHAMTWVHTWFGLVLGYVLMVIFFFGTLSVFDREIDRWAIPETRIEPQPMPSFDAMLRPIFERIEPEPEELAQARQRVGTLPQKLRLMNWSAYTTHRDPVLAMYAEYAVPNPRDPGDHVHGHVTIDARNGAVLPHDRLAIGSQFFYPMHISLHLQWLGIGYWLVGVAALVMLVLLLSGIVIHKKFLREFFTFRPNKHTQRSKLDLHNLTGVVALPFHVLFPLTGLVIFAGIYFPVSETMLKPLAEKHEQIETRHKGLPHEPSGTAAPLASVDAMVAEAKRRWAKRDMPGDVGFLAVTHVGDKNGYVTVYRAGSDRVTLVGQAIHFEATTGRVIYEEPPPSAVSAVAEFLTGLHLQHFKHWLLRWLYVFGGLSGCVCIATGLVFFVGKRKHRHAADGVGGARWMDALAVATVTGTVLATLGILIANRCLPVELAQRDSWERASFWACWALALAHAAVRTAPVQRAKLAPAWREQCCAISGLSVTAVILNWITTGDHLGRTLSRGYWPVAGFDLALLGTAAIALLAARRLRLRDSAVSEVANASFDADALDAEASHG
jgi:uncharacterized iron-regulated membrane protein